MFDDPKELLDEADSLVVDSGAMVMIASVKLKRASQLLKEKGDIEGARATEEMSNALKELFMSAATQAKEQCDCPDCTERRIARDGWTNSLRGFGNPSSDPNDIN